MKIIAKNILQASICICICFCAPEINKADNIVIRAKLSHQLNSNSFLKLSFSSDRAGRDFIVEEALFDGQKSADLPAEARHIVSCSGAHFAELSLAKTKVDFEPTKKAVHLKTIWTGTQKNIIEDNFNLPGPFKIIEMRNLEDTNKHLEITFSEPLSETLWQFCDLVIADFSFNIYSKEKDTKNNATIIINRQALADSWARSRAPLSNAVKGQIRCAAYLSNRRAASSFSELGYELSSEDFTFLP